MLRRSCLPFALAIADGIVRIEDGPLMFVPDQLLGDEPEEIRRGLKAAHTRLLDLSFEDRASGVRSCPDRSTKDALAQRARVACRQRID